MELVTFKSLKALLGLEEGSISSYPALSVIKDSVEATIEAYLGIAFGEDEREETFYNTYPAKTFALSALPIVSITSVTVDGVEVTAADGEFKRTKHGIQLTSATTADVVITYVGGYSVETLPANITRAALYQVSFEWQQKDIIGAESISTDQGTVRKPGFKLLDEVKNILDAYLHPTRIV